MSEKAGPPPMPGQPSQPPQMPTEPSSPPPMPVVADELSVEPSQDDLDTEMSSFPKALTIFISVAAAMVLTGFVIPKLVMATVPIFTVCGFWIAAKGFKLAVKTGVQRITSPLGLYAVQVAAAGLSGLPLLFFGLLVTVGASTDEGNVRIRFLLFLFAVVFFPVVIFLRSRAAKHVGVAK